MKYKYHLLIRTANSEFRTWENLTEKEKQFVIPIVEITRGDKIKTTKNENKKDINYEDKEIFYFYGKHLDRTKSLINERPCFVDTTPEDTLMCGELLNLRDYKNGYENWMNFLQDNFNVDNIYPILQVTDNELSPDDYKNSLIQQITSLSNKYHTIGYRTSILTDSDFLIDLNILSIEIIKHIESGKEFFLIFDHEDIRPRTSLFHAHATKKVLDTILFKIPQIKIIILSNSFPKNVNEIGNGNSDNITIEEILLFKEIIKGNKYSNNIYYGDYGSINSIRNDGKIGGRGWTPRIDIPSIDKITYYKEKKEMENGKQKYPYNHYYYNIANKIVDNHDLFSSIPESWAKEQIIKASESPNSVPNSQPNFWISVRMQLYLINIINQLDCIYNYKPK